MEKVFYSSPFDFAARRSGRAVLVPVRAEPFGFAQDKLRPEGEVEACTAVSTTELGSLYMKKCDGLPLDYTRVVAVVKMIRNNFVLTAYGIEKKGKSR